MSLPPGEITLTPDSCSECIVPNEWTQEEEDPNEASSEVQCPVSIKSCYMFGSFHSPSNEQLNVTPVSGAEGRKCLEDSMTKYPLDSITNISSDELFGSYHSPSNVQPNETTVIGTESQTKEFDDQNKLLLQVAEDDSVSILDESCQYANVPQDKPFSEELKSQVFGGRKTDHTDSNPDNTSEVANFPDTIPLSGSFISQSSKPVAQSTDCTPLKSVSAPPITVKMEYTREKTILTRHLDPDADRNSIHMKTTPTRKGPILLKSSSQSSRVDLSLKEKTFNQSRVNQNQSIPKAVSSTEKVGSDEDEEGHTDVCQGQLYPSPDNLDLEPSTGEPSQNMTVPISNMKMSQPHAEVSLQIISMPQPNMDTHLPNIGMPQPITVVSMQLVPTTSSQPTTSTPQLSLMDSMAPLRPPVERPRNIAGHRLSALGTGQMEDDGGYVDMTGKPQSYSNTESFEQAKTTDEHERVTVEQSPKMRNIEDSDMKEDRPQYKIHHQVTEDEVQYKKNSVKNNSHADKKNLGESQTIFHDSRFSAKEEFKSHKEASSDAQADPIESDMNTGSHKTEERLPSEDDDKRFYLVDCDDDGYARIKETDDTADLSAVYREPRDDFKPLKPRPMASAEFPLPPTPEVPKRSLSEADVDTRRKMEQPYGKRGADQVFMRPHTTDKKDIQVHRYFECFDAELGTEVFSNLTHETENTVGELKLPDPVELKDLSPLIQRFLVKNEKHRQLFEKNLSDINGVAKWPSSLEEYVIIRCTVKVEDKSASSDLKDWSVRVVDNVNTFAAGIEVAEFSLIQMAWPRVLEEMNTICVKNPEDVGVFIEQEKYKITIAGPKDTIEKLKKIVSDMIGKVAAQIPHDKQRVTEKKQMKAYAIILLRELQFKQEIEKMYPGLQFHLNQKDEMAIFVGQAGIVQKAVIQMHEKLQSFVSISMPMSKTAKDLLYVEEITDYINQKMKSQKMIGVWGVVRKDEIRMFGQDKKEAQKAIQLVRDSLIEKEISLDDVMAQNVQEQHWLQFVQKIQKKHSRKVALETSMISIKIVAVDYIFQDVFDEIKRYLEKHSVEEDFFTLEPVKVKFIKRYKNEDIKALETKVERSHMKLFIIDYEDKKGIKINGIKDGCKAVKTPLAEMAKNIITREHSMVNKIGLKELIQDSRGREQLDSIEARWKCFIEMKDSSTSDSLQLEGASGGYSSGSEDDAGQSYKPTDWQPSSDIGGASMDACGIKVSVVQGELAKQKVDVIVNSTNQNLDLSIGAISKTILKCGGDTIQKECLQQYPSGINPGQVVVTSGGELSCTKVYHGWLTAYDGGKGNSLQLMKTFVKNCLEQAHTSGFQSIAFPALGTGNLRFPADEVGKLIVRCIQTFGKKTPNTSLKDITLVVYPSDINNIKAFTALFVGPTLPSASKKRSATSSSDISMDHGICRCTFPHSVVLEMFQGDITKEMTDVIVNSVSLGLNLNQGKVSKAILEAAGISIQQECKGKDPDLKKDGYVVTSAGKLLCKRIIHIAAQDKAKKWEDMIKRVLHQADQLECKSISFPALGTGSKGLPPKKIAQAIYSACTEFDKSQLVCLKKIRVVLFEKKLFIAFVQAIKDYSPGQRDSKVSTLAGTLFKERSKPSSLVFSITIDSDSNFKAAVRDLEGFVKNEITEKEIISPREIISKLLDMQVTQLEGMGQGKAMVSVNRKKGTIRVSGTHREVLDAYDNIRKYLHSIERELFAKASAEQVPVPEVKGQEETHGTTKESCGK